MLRFIIVTFMIVLLTLSCSDLFSVRDADDPSGTGAVATSDTVNKLADNFVNSLYNMNRDEYIVLFSDSLTSDIGYQFVSFASDVSGDIFEDWTVDNERKFIDNLITTKYFEYVNITPDTFEEVVYDSTEIEFDYEMLLKDADNPNLDRIVKGHSTMNLVKSNGIWYISKWTDDFDDILEAVSISKLKEPYVR